LGCGSRPDPKYWNVDKWQNDAETVDEEVDLNEDWPWEDESVNEIYSGHAVEHLDDITHFMEECHRVLKPGGRILVRCPHGANDASMADPTHRRPLYPETFRSFCNGYDIKETYGLQHHPSRWKYDFEFERAEVVLEPWVRRIPFWKWWAIPASRILRNIIGEFWVFIKKKEK